MINILKTVRSIKFSIPVILGLAIGYLIATGDVIFRPSKVLLFSVILIISILLFFYPNPKATIYIFPLVISFPLKINQLFSITTDTTTFVLALIAGGMFLKIVLKQIDFSIKRSFLLVPIAFGSVMWISYILNGMPSRGLWEMVGWTGGIILFTIIQGSIHHESEVVKIVVLAFVGVSISALIAVYQYMVGYRGADITSTYWYYTDIAGALGMLTITIIGFLAHDIIPSRRIKLILLVMCLPNIFILMASGARGAWIGSIAGLLYLLYRVVIRRRFRYVVLFILIFIGSLEFVVSNSFLMDRFNGIMVFDQGSTFIRFIIWKDVLNIISMHWLYGIGVGKLADYLSSSQYYSDWFNSIAFYHAHNLYLQIMLNGGILASIPVGIAIGKYILSAIKVEINSYLACLYGGLLVFLVQSTFDYLIWDPANMYLLWLFLALIVKVLRIGSQHLEKSIPK